MNIFFIAHLSGTESQSVVCPAERLCVGAAAVGEDAHAGVPHPGLALRGVRHQLLLPRQRRLGAASVRPGIRYRVELGTNPREVLYNHI